MHVAVYDGTVHLDKAIAAHPDKKPSLADKWKAVGLSDRMREIDREAGQLIRMLEDKAPQSPCLKALRTLGDAARRIQYRLAKVDVGADTQTLEAGIGATLEKAVAAIRKESAVDLFAERRSKEGKELERRLEGAALKLGQNIAQLDAARSNVREVSIAVESKHFQEVDLAAQAQRVGDAERSLDRAWEAAREVHADCAAAFQALQAKQAVPRLTARLEGQVGKPLGHAIKEEFPAARQALRACRAALKAGKWDTDITKGTGERMAQLLERLREAKEALDDLPDINELIARLSEIESEQRELEKRLHDLPQRS
jgi:hypothetical protein